MSAQTKPVCRWEFETDDWYDGVKELSLRLASGDLQVFIMDSVKNPASEEEVDQARNRMKMTARQLLIDALLFVDPTIQIAQVQG